MAAFVRFNGHDISFIEILIFVIFNSPLFSMFTVLITISVPAFIFRIDGHDISFIEISIFVVSNSPLFLSVDCVNYSLCER